MKRNAIAMVLLAMLVPMSASAVDMRLGILGAAEYDSNINRTPTNEEDDGVFRISPKLDLIEDDGDFTWNLFYMPAYEVALNTSRVDGWRHFVNARADWDINRRTILRFRNDFSFSQAVTSARGIDGSGVPTIGSFDQPVYRNRTELLAEHSFTPRLMGNLGVNYRYFASDIPDRADNNTFGGNGNLRYTVNPQHQAGGGIAVTYQDFDRSNSGFRPPSNALFVNFFGIWTWVIDETTSFEATFGPTYIDNEQDAPPTVVTAPVWPSFAFGADDFGWNAPSCPSAETMDPAEFLFDPAACSLIVPVTAADAAEIAADGTQDLTFPMGDPGKTSETSWTIFAAASLSKRWTPNLASTLAYNRRDSTASGLAGSAVIDFVSLITTWRISELWSTDFRADWTRRESATDVNETFAVISNAPLMSGTQIAQTTGDLVSRKTTRALDTTRWGVQARVTRRITRNLRAALRYSFNQQDSKGDTRGSLSDFDDHLVTFSVQYDFDRWKLW